MERENEILRSRQESLVSREKKLEEKVQLLEVQLEEAMNVSVQNVSIRASNENKEDEEESESLLEQLQTEKVELLQEKQRLEQEVVEAAGRLSETEENLKAEFAKRREVEIALEGKECEVSHNNKFKSS